MCQYIGEDFFNIIVYILYNSNIYTYFVILIIISIILFYIVRINLRVIRNFKKSERFEVS